MKSKKDRNKLTELAVKQDLLLWQLSQSFLQVEQKIVKTIKKEKRG